MTPQSAIRREVAPVAAWRLIPVVLASSLAVIVMGATPPSSPGARSLADPVTLTAVAWTVTTVLAAWPGRLGFWSRASVLGVGAPAAFVLARVAVVPSGAVLAALLLAATALSAGECATRLGARGGAVLGLVWIGVPAIGLGLIELGVAGGTAFLTGSPLVGPALLAHATAEFAWVSVLPACCVNLAVAAACARSVRSPAGAAS